MKPPLPGITIDNLETHTEQARLPLRYCDASCVHDPHSTSYGGRWSHRPSRLRTRANRQVAAAGSQPHNCEIRSVRSATSGYCKQLDCMSPDACQTMCQSSGRHHCCFRRKKATERKLRYILKIPDLGMLSSRRAKYTAQQCPTCSILDKRKLKPGFLVVRIVYLGNIGHFSPME